ncbi:xin actin-binding repeat-containing protein 2-like [Brachionichthys hirsutus]|uniref:xin actin-binding repeat-containing protein 2-like n=1 Tax=Brachionichthys hirsutus TaxID=412623 RepID=UPI003604CAD1
MTDKKRYSSKPEDKTDDEICSDDLPVKTVKPGPVVICVENANSTKSQSEKKRKVNPVPELPVNLCNQSFEKENRSSDKHGSKKRKGHSPTKSQDNVSNQPVKTEKAASSRNGKTGKPNQKLKKNNKQEKQVETKMVIENEKRSISQDCKEDVEETTEVNMSRKPTEVDPELRQGMKSVTTSPAAAPSLDVTDSQPGSQTQSKKKKRSKKLKGSAQSVQGKDISTESTTDSTDINQIASENCSQIQQTTAVAQSHKDAEEDQFKKEVITTESKDNESSQQHKSAQKHVNGSPKKKGVTIIQHSVQDPPQETWDVIIPVAGKSEQSEYLESATERREESHITEIQKTKSKCEETLLSTDPDCIKGLEKTCEQDGALLPTELELIHLEDKELVEKHGSQTISEKSKICIGSAKIENQTKKASFLKRGKEEVSQCKSVNLQAPSPLLRMRSPSPTYISIESTRRTESPQRVTPSPTLLHRPPTPPTQPPRRCDTPTSRLTRITPSPTFDRAENLPRLRDTTAKLSRGVTPPPLLLPQQISETKSEIVELPASFHRQIKTETQFVDASGTSIEKEMSKKTLSGEAQVADVNSVRQKEDQDYIPEGLNANEIQSKSDTKMSLCQSDSGLVEDADTSEPSTASFREKRDFFDNKAHKADHIAEINKSCMRKEPIAIPERLGPDTVECVEKNTPKQKAELPKTDLFSLVNKFESPEEKSYFRKDHFPLTDWLYSDIEGIDNDLEKMGILEQEMPIFDIQAIKNVFEIGQQSLLKGGGKDQEKSLSSLCETRAYTPKWESSLETKDDSRKSTPIPVQKNEVERAAPSPAFSDIQSMTEHFSHVHEFGNKVTGTRTAVTGHLGSTSPQQIPFSYADAVKRKASRPTETYDGDSTEKLLRNFQKTWAESESVFKSLGYTVSEETTSQVISHQTKIVSSGSSSEVGAMYSMSEESLSDGCSDSRHKKIP